MTDPKGLVTTTTYDPARDLPLTVTNPAGWITAETYDALGRLTAVWKPGHPQGTVPADDTFSYTVSNTAPSVVTTKTINATGSYLPSETLYDSLGRAVETQTQTPDGKGRDITDTAYNSDGWKLLDSSSYYTTGAPNGTLVTAPDDQVPSQTGYVYDGDGRVIKQISYKFAAETWETDTSYGGDYTTVVPPSGGTSQTTFTDGEGNKSAIYQYHSGVPADPSDPAADYDKTSYTYTPAQQLASHHRRGRQPVELRLQPVRRPDVRDRPRRGHHHQQLRRRRAADEHHRRPRQAGLVHLRRRRPQDRRVRHHRGRRGERRRRAGVVDLRHPGQGPADLLHQLRGRHRRVGLHRGRARLHHLRAAERDRDRHPVLSRGPGRDLQAGSTPTAPTAT